MYIWYILYYIASLNSVLCLLLNKRLREVNAREVGEVKKLYLDYFLRSFCKAHDTQYTFDHYIGLQNRSSFLGHK